MSSFAANAPNPAAVKATAAKAMYQTAMNASTGSDSRLFKLQQAYRMFIEARKLILGGQAEEWLMLTKNIATVCTRIATDEALQGKNSSDLTTYYFKEATSYNMEALLNGQRINLGSEWSSAVEAKLVTLAEEFAKYCVRSIENNWQKRVALLTQVAEYVKQSPAAHIAVQLKICEEYLKICVVLFEEAGDWRASSSLLAEMNRPMEEISVQSFHFQEPNGLSASVCYEEFLESFFSLKRRVESTKFRQLAQESVNELLVDVEEWRQELLDDAVDLLRLAIRAAKGESTSENAEDKDKDLPNTGNSSKRGFDMECEAIAFSRLGVLYAKLRIHTPVAQQCLYQCITLADAIKDCDGRTFFRCAWWKDAKDELEKIRKARECFDDEELRKRREPTMAKIKPLLDAIDAEEKKSESLYNKMNLLLEFLLKTHPPKSQEKAEALRRKKDDAKLNDKAAYQKLMVLCAAAYHTDVNKEHGTEWYFLCEEIVKKINGYNNTLKGM